MTDEDFKTLSTKKLEELAAQGTVKAKQEFSRRLLEGRSNKNKEKAVALLEDCVSCGDDDALLMLANCCALGLGTNRDVERAKALVREAAKKGQEEGQSLMRLLEIFKNKSEINVSGLPKS